LTAQKKEREINFPSLLLLAAFAFVLFLELFPQELSLLFQLSLSGRTASTFIVSPLTAGRFPPL
jgi:hypothetical protein